MNDEITMYRLENAGSTICAASDRLDPVSTWHSLVKRYFHGDLKPPFNIAARNAAVFQRPFMARLPQEMIWWHHPKKGQSA